MSDNDNGDIGKTKGGKIMSWTEHEVLVYVFSAMEHSNFKIDFNNAPVPVGRNASGCSQKINKMKIALRAEMDALKAGEPLSAAGTEATPKKTPRKRKVKGEDADDADGSPKKRGRGRPSKKKEAEAEAEAEAEEQEEKVKSEMQDDDMQIEDEA